MSASLSRCPRCGTARLVAGSSKEPINFVANSASFGGLRSGVPVNTWFRVCGECGFLFGELAVADLLEQLGRFPDARVKQWLTEKPDRPL